MARNRQRAKQRKARQQAQGGQPAADAAADANGETKGDAVAAASSATPVKAEAKSAKKADSAPRERGRVSGFFRSVWAELKRVQWPDRRQVTTLTSVVIGFVIIAGAYLGVIDAIAKRVVDLVIF